MGVVPLIAKKIRLTSRSEKTASGVVGSRFSNLKLEKPNQASLTA